MAKRLGIDQIQEMKDMVQNGIAPEDIAKHFNIAISSVHNYKARFKSEGLDVPNMRGKRPTGSVTTSSKAPVKKQQSVIGVVNQSKQSENFKFIVNGVSVQISAQAKSVNIDKNTMEINF